MVFKYSNNINNKYSHFKTSHIDTPYKQTHQDSNDMKPADNADNSFDLIEVVSDMAEVVAIADMPDLNADKTQQDNACAVIRPLGKPIP